MAVLLASIRFSPSDMEVLGRRWTRLLLCAVVVCAGVAWPAVCKARPGYEVHNGGMDVLLVFGKIDGRLVSVSADGRQRVRIEVSGLSGTMVTFTTQGRVSTRRIEADFGKYGRIDVDLGLARYESAHDGRRRCSGRGKVQAEGTFRGVAKLSLEAVGVVFSRRKGRAFFERRFRRVCGRADLHSRLDPYPKLKRRIEEAVLTVRGKGEGRTVRLWLNVFALRRHPGRSGAYFYVEAYEKDEDVLIHRTTGGYFDAPAFQMSKRGAEPETVAVKPPAPFGGSALFSRGGDLPSSWTGDLKANLPGAGGVSLTGPGFTMTFCRGWVDACLD